jgi:hypothetical protein
MIAYVIEEAVATRICGRFIKRTHAFGSKQAAMTWLRSRSAAHNKAVTGRVFLGNEQASSRTVRGKKTESCTAIYFSKKDQYDSKNAFGYIFTVRKEFKDEISI